jgi:hypothetical protein
MMGDFVLSFRERLPVAWERLPLGVDPDETIAARVGCSAWTVARHRKRLGIRAPGHHPIALWADDVAARDSGGLDEYGCGLSPAVLDGLPGLRRSETDRRDVRW